MSVVSERDLSLGSFMLFPSVGICGMYCKELNDFHAERTPTP